jgi:hypothetical protein
LPTYKDDEGNAIILSALRRNGSALPSFIQYNETHFVINATLESEISITTVNVTLNDTVLSNFFIFKI